MRLQAIILVSLAASIGLAADPNTKRIDLSKGESRVEFLAIGKPSFIKIQGKGGKLFGDLSLSDASVLGSIKFQLGSLETGISMRDSHMKEKYLNVAQYPTAELTLKSVSDLEKFVRESIPLKGSAFSGLLKLHGIEKPVAGRIDLERKGRAIKATATFGVKLSEHGIEIPTYMGIKVSEEVQVETFYEGPLEDSK